MKKIPHESSKYFKEQRGGGELEYLKRKINELKTISEKDKRKEA
jgi:hypothetical protein